MRRTIRGCRTPGGRVGSRRKPRSTGLRRCRRPQHPSTISLHDDYPLASSAAEELGRAIGAEELDFRVVAQRRPHLRLHEQDAHREHLVSCVTGLHKKPWTVPYRTVLVTGPFTVMRAAGNRLTMATKTRLRPEQAGAHRTIKTEQGAWLTSPLDTLPTRSFLKPERPRVPDTIRSTPSPSAKEMMSSIAEAG